MGAAAARVMAGTVAWHERATTAGNPIVFFDVALGERARWGLRAARGGGVPSPSAPARALRAALRSSGGTRMPNGCYARGAARA